MTNPNEESAQSVFLICNEIEFYPESHLLRSRSEQKELTLFSTASRCLEMMLRNHGETVPKRDLMSFGWSDHGLTVSPNTFYQNISALRRSLAELLPEKNIVVTVKRAGLLVPLAIEVSEIKPQADMLALAAVGGNDGAAENSHSGGDYAPVVAEPPGMQITAAKARKNYGWPLVWLLVILIILAGFLYRMSANTPQNLPDGSPFKSYVLYKNFGGRCAVYVNPGAGLIDKTNKFLNIDAAGCKGYERVYVTLFEGSAKSSAMYCSMMKNTGISCVSEYFARSQR